jgi:hypothetical protein
MSRRLPRVLFLGVVVAGFPGVAAPQPVVRRGANAGGVSFSFVDGEPISFFLEHSRELELRDDQKSSLMEIRRRLRQVNAPYVARYDSLRRALGISLEPRPRMLPGEMDALERLRKLAQPVVDTMRLHNQTAQAEGRLVLEEFQRARLDSLVARRIGPDPRGRRGAPPPSG